MRWLSVLLLCLSCEGWESTPPFPDCAPAEGCAAGCDLCTSPGSAAWLLCDGDRVEISERCDANDLGSS